MHISYTRGRNVLNSVDKPYTLVYKTQLEGSINHILIVGERTIEIKDRFEEIALSYCFEIDAKVKISREQHFTF